MYYQNNEITLKDYLRIRNKHSEDKVIRLKVLYKGKKWKNYNDVENINFEKALKVIIVFKKHNPMFVRTLEDDFAMEKVNRNKKQYKKKKWERK